MEMTAYVLLLIVAVVWLIAMILGMIVAFPLGILGLLVIVGVGLLFIKVLKERLSDKEDEYYSKNIDR